MSTHFNNLNYSSIEENTKIFYGPKYIKRDYLRYYIGYKYGN